MIVSCSFKTAFVSIVKTYPFKLGFISGCFPVEDFALTRKTTAKVKINKR